MEVPICAERGDLWGGLTVRIGAEQRPCDGRAELTDGTDRLLRTHTER